MQISANSLLKEMKSLSGEIPTGSITPQISQQVRSTSGSDFGEMLSQAVSHVGELQANSGDLSTRLEMGDTRVSLSDTVIAREKASVAFEATVQVRNKLVEAYKEIMSMPV